MLMLRRAGLSVAFFCVPIALVVAFAYFTDPRRSDSYDLLFTMGAKARESGILDLERRQGPDFRYLVGHFERYRPFIEKWILVGPGSYEGQIAISACHAKGPEGARVLADLTDRSKGPQRLSIVQALGEYGHVFRDMRVREIALEKVRTIEKENSVEGHMAYCILSSSVFRFADHYSVQDRERVFLDRHLDPYANSREFPGFRLPLGSTLRPDRNVPDTH